MKKMNPDSKYWKYECCRSEKRKEYSRLWQLEHTEMCCICTEQHIIMKDA